MTIIDRQLVFTVERGRFEIHRLNGPLLVHIQPTPIRGLLAAGTADGRLGIGRTLTEAVMSVAPEVVEEFLHGT